MKSDFFDPIISDVRKNREELLQSFDGDVQELDKHLKTQRTKWEAAGFVYETEIDRQTRIDWHCKQQEAESKRIANL